jgi:hypothetical protein
MTPQKPTKNLKEIQGYSHELRALTKEELAEWMDYRLSNKMYVSFLAWNLVQQHRIQLKNMPETIQRVQSRLDVICHCSPLDLLHFGHNKDCKQKTKH